MRHKGLNGRPRGRPPKPRPATEAMEDNPTHPAQPGKMSVIIPPAEEVEFPEPEAEEAAADEATESEAAEDQVTDPAEEPEKPMSASDITEPAATTIHEPVAVPIEDLLDEFYFIIVADPTKQYFLHRAKTNPRHGTSPINQHYLMVRHYRPLKVEVPEGKVLVLQYEFGHPEHPAGATQFVAEDQVIWVRDIGHKHKEEASRRQKDNPNLSESEDVRMVHGKNGAMVLDKKSPFIPGSDQVGEKMLTREQILKRETEIASAKDNMPPEFYDSLNRAAEASIAK